MSYELTDFAQLCENLGAHLERLDTLAWQQYIDACYNSVHAYMQVHPDIYWLCVVLLGLFILFMARETWRAMCTFDE